MVGYWVFAMVGVVFLILPVAALPLNGGGWWWSLYVPAWIFCWVCAVGAISSSIDEIRKTDPESPWGLPPLSLTPRPKAFPIEFGTVA